MSASTVEQALGPEPKLEQELQEEVQPQADLPADSTSIEGASLQPQAAVAAPAMPEGLSKMEQMKVSVFVHSLFHGIDHYSRYTLIARGFVCDDSGSGRTVCQHPLLSRRWDQSRS
eukprot:COSAG02_NODE_31818_length_526_cov_170.515222_1_plen_116_part_00